MRDGRRRNRNIGTAKAGHGRDNRFVVPEPSSSPGPFFLRLSRAIVVERDIAGVTLRFVVEPTRRSFVHPCTIDDLVEVLHLVPPADLQGVAFIGLRQPTRTQATLEPVWGRRVPFDHDTSALILDAQQPLRPFRWSRALSPPAAAELDRLRSEGHTIVGDRRGYRIVGDHAAMRTTQLFRTLPHEIGHHLDQATRSAREREDFAEAYARAFRATHHLRLFFPPRLSLPSLARDGLNATWFTPPDGA